MRKTNQPVDSFYESLSDITMATLGIFVIFFVINVIFVNKDTIEATIENEKLEHEKEVVESTLRKIQLEDLQKIKTQKNKNDQKIEKVKAEIDSINTITKSYSKQVAAIEESIKKEFKVNTMDAETIKKISQELKLTNKRTESSLKSINLKKGKLRQEYSQYVSAGSDKILSLEVSLSSTGTIDIYSSKHGTAYLSEEQFVNLLSGINRGDGFNIVLDSDLSSIAGDIPPNLQRLNKILSSAGWPSASTGKKTKTIAKTKTQKTSKKEIDKILASLEASRKKAEAAKATAKKAEVAKAAAKKAEAAKAEVAKAAAKKAEAAKAAAKKGGETPSKSSSSSSKSSSSKQPASSLAGVVTNADGNALVGANVVVEGTNLRSATDELGRYYIGVPVGNYTVRAEHSGYSTVIKSGVRTSGGSTTTTDFALQKKRYKNPRYKFIPYEKAPKPITPIKPKYPKFAQDAGIEGKIIVQCFIDEEGIVQDAVVIEGMPDTGLDESAVEAIQKTKFEPARQRELPVGVWITIPVNFTLY